MENTPPPPSATTRQKSPVLIGLKRLCFVLIGVLIGFITPEIMSCIHIKQYLLGVNEMQHVRFILGGMN